MKVLIRYEADADHAYAVRHDGHVYIGTCVEYPDVSVESEDEHEALVGIMLLVRVLDEEKNEFEERAASPSC